MQISDTLRIGDHVRVRRQRWSVVAVRRYDAGQVIALAGIDRANAGVSRSFITPFDVIEPIAAGVRLRVVGGRRWRHGCRTLLASERSSGGLRTVHAARIDLLPHQLEPALALLRGAGSRVLIADAVGLGKTIQAGVIVSELAAAGAADRTLVLTPAGLRDQWSAELRDRFGLAPAVVDMRDARRRAATLPIGMNPWIATPLAIASMDYVKRPEVLPAVLACRWDLVIVDEAHVATPASDRRAAVDALCRQAAYVVLLTATPHSGDREAFAALCRIGDLASARPLPLLIFRRDRRSVGLPTGRRVHCLEVRPTRPERLMHERLLRFVAAMRRDHPDRAIALPMATLLKRALSSARSLHASVLRRLTALADATADPHGQLALPIGDDDFDPTDEAPAWSAPGLLDTALERTVLTDLAAAALAASLRESKLIALARLLRSLQRLGERAIVFTEYRDTLLHVAHTLRAVHRNPSPGPPWALLHGGLGRDDRQRVIDGFRAGRFPVLLATDAGGEGLNLQQACRVVVNLELPWNPMRLEQRIGRVDRIGQARRVHAFNLVLKDSGEPRVFARLKARIDIARQDIDVADPLTSDDEEVTTYRAVIGGVPEPPAVSPQSRSGEPCVAFKALAEAERGRIVRARALFIPGAPAPTLSDTLICRARRTRTRAWLARNALVIAASLLEDICGQAIACRITPLLVRLDDRIRRSHPRTLADAIVRGLRGRCEAELTGDSYAAFWHARLARERAIAAALCAPGLMVQQGLFDDRSEQEIRRRDAAAGAAALRLGWLESMARSSAIRHHVALILVP